MRLVGVLIGVSKKEKKNRYYGLTFGHILVRLEDNRLLW